MRCFERGWAHAASYDARRGSVSTWLVAIAHHVAVDAARAQRAVPIDPSDLVALMRPDERTAEQHAVDIEAGAELRAGLAALPPEQARAVVMAAVHGYTAREIAERERVPLGTAKTRIRAAVSKLDASQVTGRDHA